MKSGINLHAGSLIAQEYYEFILQPLWWDENETLIATTSMCLEEWNYESMDGKLWLSNINLLILPLVANEGRRVSVGVNKDRKLIKIFGKANTPINYLHPTMNSINCEQRDQNMPSNSVNKATINKLVHDRKTNTIAIFLALKTE